MKFYFNKQDMKNLNLFFIVTTQGGVDTIYVSKDGILLTIS